MTLPTPSPAPRRLPALRPQEWPGLAAAFLLLGLVGGLCVAWPTAGLPAAGPAMLHVLAVMVAATWLGRLASVAYAVAAALCYSVFCETSLGLTHLVQGWPSSLLTLACMVSTALWVGWLAGQAREQAHQARLSAQRTAGLQALSTRLAEADSDTQVLQWTQAALEDSLGGPCRLVLLQAAQAGKTLPRMGPADAAEPVWTDGEAPLVDLPRGDADAFRCCVRERAVLGPGTTRWPDLAHWYLPLSGGGSLLGAARLTPPAADRAVLLAHAQSLCALAGQAVWRIRWATSARLARAQSDRHALRNTLLAAVSHDLRTPLAAIVGAASVLELQGERLPAAERQRMLASIRTEADHLSAITDNTLQLMRLSGDGVQIQRDWESVEEVVGTVLGRVRQRDWSRRIKAHVPADLPLIKADPTLLAQLLDNLLDNALKHGEGVVDLRVSVIDGRMAIEVKDRGPGVDPAVLAQFGQSFVRGAAARSRRGSGLGLAVCNAIVRAHGGEFTARRRQGGGSCFSVLFPIDMPQPQGAP